MDSITQIVLGAAVGEAILGRHLGNKALLLGAIAGTLPDMDIVMKLYDNTPLFEIKSHRSYSHSGFVHLAISVPLAWLSIKWSKTSLSFSRWYLFWFLGLFTHALLDCCTTYGTRLFLPFSSNLVAFNNISVIDPLYTLPFLLLLIVMMFFKRNTMARKKLFYSAIVVSSMYMAFTFLAKFIVHQKFKKSLVNSGIVVDNLNSTPTILNAILWCGIAVNQDFLYSAEYSFFRPQVPIKWVAYPRNLQLVDSFDSDAMRTLHWFSDGMFFIIPDGYSKARYFNAKFGKMNYTETAPEKAFLFYAEFDKDSANRVEFSFKTPSSQRAKQDFGKMFHSLTDRIGL